MQATIEDLIAATAEAIGSRLSPAAVAIMAEELEGVGQEQVYAALKRCRRECKRLTVKDVLDRLPGGHPGPEEAWATVVRSFDESRSIVWTGEMEQASAPAAELWAEGDKVAARMAFKERYQELVAQSGNMPEWSFDGGTDYQNRIEVAGRAFSEGKISSRTFEGWVQDSCASLNRPPMTDKELRLLAPPPPVPHAADRVFALPSVRGGDDE